MIKKDKGICHICDKQIDLNDYHIDVDGNFIAGESYPSIDHVIPVAKGGTHTWDNVSLAHRSCNNLKNDKIYIEDSKGQLKMYI